MTPAMMKMNDSTPHKKCSGMFSKVYWDQHHDVGLLLNLIHSLTFITVQDRKADEYSNGVCESPRVALGIGDLNIIPDSAFLASSNYSSEWDASKGRICEASNAWCTPFGRIAKNGKEWWQVDLGRLSVIQQIAIQINQQKHFCFFVFIPTIEELDPGYIHKRNKNATDMGVKYLLRQFWIRSFSLGYSDDGMAWNKYLINGVKKVFDGNVNATSVVKVALPVPIKSRYLRVWIESYKCINDIARICGRFELYGCKV